MFTENDDKICASMNGDRVVTFPWDAKMTENQIIHKLIRLLRTEHGIHVDSKTVYNADGAGAHQCNTSV